MVITSRVYMVIFIKDGLRETLLLQEVKSSQYSPQSKEQNPQQAEQGHAQMQQCV
jgi:hypothetical protein